METDRPRMTRHKVSGEDFFIAEELLKVASLTIKPDDQCQRRAFERLMPQLFVLRDKGCSIPQITNLLNQIGFKFQPSTVRVYYNEALATRMDICQSTMKDQLLLLAEIRKQTKGADIGMMVGRVEAVMEKQREQVAFKMDAVLPLASKPASCNASPSPLPVAQHIPAVAARKSVPLTESPPGEFQRATHRVETSVPELRDQPTARPVISQAAMSTNGTVALSTVKLRCSKLPDGAPPVNRRENVAKEIYQEGDFEHPDVPGVMLSLTQRLSSIALEFVNTEDGTTRMETQEEKRWRLLWRKPIPMTESRTSGSFTPMNHSLFENKSSVQKTPAN